ncbi:MAG TPA: carboxypeptidase-like regulatory domain-containing protein [Gaiellaceae bacterium]|jgi:hypothetical protein|nr:carboxypeptidase-like regulatory domain-containing protein [Gaiellaceae bacterium]
MKPWSAWRAGRQVCVLMGILAGALLPISSVSAAAPLNVTGTWNSVYHCKSGGCAGQDFPAAAPLIQAKGSTRVMDPTGQVTGTLVGHTLTLHGVVGTYIFNEVVTISADGNSWSGTLSDSNKTSGTDTATRPPQKFELSGKILAVSCGLQSSSCAHKPEPASGISVKATGASSGSAVTDANGAYSMKLPAGDYTVTPHDGNRGFDPDPKMVDLTSDTGNVNFTTCATEDATINTTLHRGSTLASASSTTTLKGHDQKNGVTIQVTPCGKTGATVAVTKWIVAPECEAPGGTSAFITISPFKKQPFPFYPMVGVNPAGTTGVLGLRLPKAKGFLANGNDRVTVRDHNGHVVMIIALGEGHRRATVTIQNGSPDLITRFENDITNNSGMMSCRPQSDTLSVAG